MRTKMVRLVDDYTLLDFAGGMSEEEADRHRELLEESEKRAKNPERSCSNGLASTSDDG